LWEVRHLNGVLAPETSSTLDNHRPTPFSHRTTPSAAGIGPFAGIVRRTPTAEIEDAEWDLVDQVNVRGALNCCQAVMIGGMRARG